MLAHWIGQQTEKLRARQKAEGRVEGLVEGRAEQDAEWREWYQRQIDRGAALDEPPPTPDSRNEKE